MHRNLSEAIFRDQTKFCFNESLLTTRRWKIFTCVYPKLEVEFNDGSKPSIRVRMRCEDWDETPPSIDLLDANGDLMQNYPTGQGVFNNTRHKLTGRPFICSPGSLEYHTHESHINDKWENYKGKDGYDLGGILTQIWNAWKASR